MYNMVQKLDVSKARSQLPNLMEKTYFEGQEFILLRRGIPMAAVVGINKLERKESLRPSMKKNTTRLFGIWKNKKAKTVEIADSLRKLAWNSHAR